MPPPRQPDGEMPADKTASPCDQYTHDGVTGQLPRQDCGGGDRRMSGSLTNWRSTSSARGGSLPGGGIFSAASSGDSWAPAESPSRNPSTRGVAPLSFARPRKPKMLASPD